MSTRNYDYGSPVVQNGNFYTSDFTGSGVSSIPVKASPGSNTVLSSNGVSLSGESTPLASSKGGIFKNINWNQVGEAAANAGMSMAGDVAYNYASGRKTSKAGNILHTASSYASAIPGIGSGVSALLNIVGGFVNSQWGSYLDEEAIKAMKQRVNAYAQDYSSPSSNEQLLADYSMTGGMDHITEKDINSEGSKAYDVVFDINNQIDQANRTHTQHLLAAANSLDSDYDRNMRANYSAFGGPVSGAIDYGIMSDYLSLKKQQIDKNTINNRQLADGGNIFLLPARRAAFAPIDANLKAFGGDTMTNGATWDNGFTYIGNGGTHEANPNEGVQVGVDAQGVPDLVEEGEVVWNDYVFSKRLKVPQSFRDKYKLKNGGPLSFAEAATKINEEMKERPNDPLSKRGRDAMLTSLMDKQEEIRAKKAQREARNQFNSLPPEQQLGIMQMAQQQAMQGGPEGDMNNEEQMMSPEEQAPLMSAFGGNLVHRHDFGDWLKKNFGNNVPTGTFLEELKKLYGYAYRNPEKLLKDDFGIMENTGFDNILDALGKENGAMYEKDKKGFDDSWTFSNITPRIWQNTYNRFKNNKEAFELEHSNIPYESRFDREYLKLWNPESAKAYYPEETRYFLRDTDANGNPIATQLSNIPAMYEGMDLKTGQTWEEALKAIGYTKAGSPQKSTVGDTEYTDYFLNKIASTPVEAKKREDTKITMPIDLQQTATRFAPIVGSGVGVLTDALGITNTPDTTPADTIERALDRVSRPSLVRAQTIGDTMEYKPFSTLYYANRIAPQTRATANNLMDAAAGNPEGAMAGLLTLDRNAADQMGDLFRKGEEYNFETKSKALDFNRASRMFNAQQALTADRANQQEKRQAAAAYASGIAQIAGLNQKAQQYADAARSTNLTNFLQGLGDMGNENEQRNWLKTLYASGYFGNSPTMERVLYSDNDVLSNFMKNNKGASVDDVVAATGIGANKVKRYFKKNNITV